MDRLSNRGVNGLINRKVDGHTDKYHRQDWIEMKGYMTGKQTYDRPADIRNK